MSVCCCACVLCVDMWCVDVWCVDVWVFGGVGVWMCVVVVGVLGVHLYVCMWLCVLVSARRAE